MKTININDSLIFLMVDDEARELSVKWQNTIYVILRNNNLFTTLIKEKGVVLSIWNNGNKQQIINFKHKKNETLF